MKKITIILFSLLILLSGCSQKEPIKKSDFLLNTVVSVTIYDNPDEKILNEVFDEMKNIEDKMSLHRENSEVVKINKMAGKKPVKVSKETLSVIKKSISFSKLTKGKVDITIGPIVSLWDIGSGNKNIPTKEKIEKKVSLINYKNIDIDENSQTVYLKNKNMKIDLGSIAKGYVADRVKEILEKNNVKDAIINLGGNIYAMGKKQDDKKFKIGIQDPKDDKNKPLGYVKVSNKSVVTSGIYERYFEKDNKRYHHILDVKTGYPVRNDLAGISIISDESIDGDGLSTSIFTLGLKEGIEKINQLKNVEAIFITKDNKIYFSDNIKKKFNLMKSNYEIID
ncbi:MAG: FAD:protein FMN transferase [Bacillota bacterium]